MSDTSDNSQTVAVLFVERANGEKKEFELSAGTSFRLGRGSSNDLVLDDTRVSRYHAVFNASSSGLILSDLSSLNGTFVAEQRINTPVNLRSGDIVDIGETRITITIGVGQSNKKSGSIGGETLGAVTQPGMLQEVVVTILVADVVSYTRLSEALPAEDVADMLRAWFEQTAEVVSEYGGQVDKYIGDCVMALWRGGKDDADSSASAAIEAAKAIHARTAELSASDRWKHHMSFPWRTRIALNSGEALMGTLGPRGAPEYTVLGDSVNVAFRLEALAGELDCALLLGEDTAELVKDNYGLKKLGQYDIKGRNERVRVYRLV